MKKGIRRIGKDASIVGNIRFRRDQRRAEAMNSSFSKPIPMLAYTFYTLSKNSSHQLTFCSLKDDHIALDHSKFALEDLPPPSSNPAVLSLQHARAPRPLAIHRANRVSSPRSLLFLILILLIVDVHKVRLGEEDPVIVEALLRCEF